MAIADTLTTASERAKLDVRIMQREQNQADESLLSQGVHDVLELFSSKDAQSLATLKKLRTSGASNSEIETALAADQQDSDWRDTAARYTTTFAKVVPLFVGRGKCMALSALVFGADQVRTSTSPAMMAVDFCLGATKGLATKYMLDNLGTLSAPGWQKGAVLGGGMALLDTALSSGTWYDYRNGQFHLTQGLKNTASSSVIGAGTGTLVFPAAQKLAAGVSELGTKFLGTSLSQPLLANLSVGGSFGVISGAVGETEREIASGERLNPASIARGAAFEGVTDLLAAGAGYGLGQVLIADHPMQAASAETKSGDTEPRTRSEETARMSESPQSITDHSAWLKEDPQRILQVAARVSQNDLTVDSSLTEAVKQNADLTKTLTGAQIRDGLRTILLSPNPTSGLDYLMSTGVMQDILPEVAAMTGPGSEQSWQHHSEGNVWQHTELVMSNLQPRLQGIPADQQFTEELGALLHDIGKMDTQVVAPDGRISNPGHAELGADQARALLERLDLDPKTTDDVVSIVHDHMRMHSALEMKPSTLDGLLADPLIEPKIRLQASDAEGSVAGTPPEGEAPPQERNFGSYEDFLGEKLAQYRANLLAKANEKPPMVTPKMLMDAGVKPGPELGTMLKAAKQAQAAGEIASAADVAAWLENRFGLHLNDQARNP